MHVPWNPAPQLTGPCASQVVCSMVPPRGRSWQNTAGRRAFPVLAAELLPTAVTPQLRAGAQQTPLPGQGDGRGPSGLPAGPLPAWKPAQSPVTLGRPRSLPQTHSSCHLSACPQALGYPRSPMSQVCRGRSPWPRLPGSGVWPQSPESDQHNVNQLHIHG